MRSCLRLLRIATHTYTPYRLPQLNYTIKFHFAPTIQDKDCLSLLTQLNKLFDDKQSSDKIAHIVWQLRPYIPKLGFDQLKQVATISNTTGLSDEVFSTKVFDRTMELLLNNNVDVGAALSMLDLLLTSTDTYSQKFYQSVLNFIAAVTQAPSLTPVQIALSTMNYGIIVSYTQQSVKEIEDNIVEHFKKQVDNFKSSDLRYFSLGISMAQFQGTAVWDYIDRQVTSQPMDYEDLVRVATAFTMNDAGSKELWDLINSQTLTQLKDQTPDVVAMVIMFYKQSKHGDEAIFNEMEKHFMANYDKYDIYDSILMFSGFASKGLGSSELWQLFETDLQSLVEQGQLNEVTMLVHDTLNMVDQLSGKTLETFLNYIRQHGKDMHVQIRDQIFDKLQNQDLLTDDIEDILLKKH